MENHPIPQDVTGFKFRIIGSVTIKQFGYILAGGVLCLIIFLMHLNILLTIPLMLLFGGFGLALAFIPIEGRPMDKMITNFVKVLPKENQYVYHKKGVNLSEMEMFKPVKVVSPKIQQLTTSVDETKKRELTSLLRNSSFRPEKDEMDFFQNLKTEFDNPNAVIKSVLPATPLQAKPTIPTSSAQPVSLPKTEPASVTPTQQIVNPVMTPKLQSTPIAPPQETAQPVVKMPIQADTVQMAPAMPTSSITAQQQIPTQKPIETNTQPIVQQPQTPTIPVQPAAASTVASDAKAQLNAGFPILPDIPNIVLGVVRDARGKALQYVLVEVLDQNDIPVRAFKTNQLGQFTAATPLANGTYRVVFEDPQKKHDFEPLEITLDGASIFQPLIITSVDQREKLRRELFEGSRVTSP